MKKTMIGGFCGCTDPGAALRAGASRQRRRHHQEREGLCRRGHDQIQGTIPARATAVVVRSYDSYADVYVDGKVVYISTSALLHKDISSKYVATLDAGTKVYQRADTNANEYTLKHGGTVKVCKVAGEWALVQSTGKKARTLREGSPG